MLDQDSLCYLVKFWRARAEQAEAQVAEATPAAAPAQQITFAASEAPSQLPVIHQRPEEPDYRAELDDAQRTIHQLRRDLRSAQAEVRWLEAKLSAVERHASATPRNRDEARFQAVKREFARRYHPSTNPSEGLGSRLGQKAREAIFKDFWPMFEGTEEGYERSSTAA